jgi:hypothetical protein
VPAMCGRAGVEAPGRSMVVWSVRSSYLTDGRDDLPRHADAADGVVRRSVADDQPPRRRQARAHAGLPECSRSGFIGFSADW